MQSEGVLVTCIGGMADVLYFKNTFQAVNNVVVCSNKKGNRIKVLGKICPSV